MTERIAIRLKEMHAHTGVCEICHQEMVKMSRNSQTLQLEPQHCWCIACGQLYYMEIDDINKWELGQWQEKRAEAT